MLIRPIHRRAVLAGVVALGLGLSVAACGGVSDAAVTTTATSPDATPPGTTSPGTTTPNSAPATTAPTTTAVTSSDPATTTSPTATEPVETELVNVYWGWSVLNPASGSPERIGAGGRDVAGDEPVRNALEAMTQGPNAAEQSIGMTSCIPAGTQVHGVSLDGSTATVDLSAEFTASSGILDETMRLAQVVFTVTQFEGIDRVRFQVDGDAQATMLSHGYEVADGLTRDDFEVVRPSILIEQPYPGAEVTDPLVIQGESNTFEATVRYAITSGGGDGVVVADGFATATNGNGTWGRFEIVIDLADLASEYQPGPGSVVMWEDSPLDGTQLGIVEIPVILPER